MEHARGASPRHHNSGTARPDPQDTLNFLHFTADDGEILANPEDFATAHTREFNAALFASYRDGLQNQRTSLATAAPNFGRSSRTLPPKGGAITSGRNC